MTVEQLYKECSRVIGNASDTPALDARIIIQYALGLDDSAFMLKGPQEVPSIDAERILGMAHSRRDGTPVAYITGHRGFFMDDFLVNESTLIPRADTEVLVEHAISKSKPIILHKTDNIAHIPANKPLFSILDMCCGTGCIGISLAKALALELEKHNAGDLIGLTLSDISEGAATVCRQNASNILGACNPCKPSRVCWNVVTGDLFSTVGDSLFDIIVTNPPYIRRDVIPTLDEQVKNEPRLALDGGDDGLDAICRIVEDAPKHLVTGGWMLMEIGFDQGDAVKRLFASAGFVDVCVEKDLGGRDRVVIGRI